MKTPRGRSEVTKEWVEHMLTEFESRNNLGSKVTLQSWDIGDATNKGDGYSGDLVKLEAKGTVQCTGKAQHEKEYHHILKFMSPEPFMHEMLKRFHTYGNESKIYSSIIEDLNKFQADHSDNQFPINIPKHIYSKDTNKEQILVMENMKILDYDNNPKKNGLGLEEAKLALEQLARLHGVSYTYHTKNDFLTKYPNFKRGKMHQMMAMGQDGIIDMVIEFLKTQDEHEDLLKKVIASKPHTVKKMNDAFNERNGQVYCLNHGDPWNNNILIKQSANAKEEKVVFVDWEFAHWNTSSYDLNYFLAGATTPELRKNHLDDLLQHYYSHFTRVTNTLGSPVPGWGFEQLSAEFDAVSAWGFGKSLTFSMILSEAIKDWKLANHELPSAIATFLMKGIAKVLMPLFIKPSMMEMMKKGKKKKLSDPVLKELKTNSNKDLNVRFLDCILEADQKGIFDI
ncbi:unnamed protein product [Meganyctiphanes norvegica]|uniref:CHK kinase-like domain-containing protein n=1 Tax=Meganyctiphanes norvegica TaxID=48144 RepID=A0AAV2QQB0_MEGNR